MKKKYINLQKQLTELEAMRGGNPQQRVIIYTNLSREIAQKLEEKDDILGDIVLEENGFRVQNNRIQQVKENIKSNETEKIRIRDKNKQLMKDLDVKFNLLNRDRISVTKQPNETDEQYFQRIKELEATTVDPNIYKDKAALEEIKKLKRNLKDILNDPSKIEDIIKKFPNSQDIYIINLNWKKISEFLKSKYGVNSKFATVNEYIDEITKALENVQTGTFKTVLASQPKRPGPQGRTGERGRSGDRGRPGRPGRGGRPGRQGREGPKDKKDHKDHKDKHTKTF